MLPSGSTSPHRRTEKGDEVIGNQTRVSVKTSWRLLKQAEFEICMVKAFHEGEMIELGDAQHDREPNWYITKATHRAGKENVPVPGKKTDIAADLDTFAVRVIA
jgi:hypothetical protein